MTSDPVNQLATAAAGLYKVASDRGYYFLKMCGWALVHGAALLALVAVQPVAAADGVATVPTEKKTEKAPKPKPKAKATNAKHEWFVQAGAFANEANAQNVRTKIEATGLQSTAEPSDTKAGRLIRVRVGPFDSKAEAKKAALRIKSLDLPAVLVRQ